jgi:hypothetical protein
VTGLELLALGAGLFLVGQLTLVVASLERRADGGRAGHWISAIGLLLVIAGSVAEAVQTLKGG